MKFTMKPKGPVAIGVVGLLAALLQGPLVGHAFDVQTAHSFSADTRTPAKGSVCLKVGAIRKTENGSLKCLVVGNRKVWRRVSIVPSGSSIVASTTTIPSGPTSPLSEILTYRPIDQCKIENKSSDWRVSQGFGQNPFRVKSGKMLRALMFPIDFPDLVGDANPSEYLTPLADEVSKFFSLMSEGRTSIKWTIQPTFARYPSDISSADLGGRTTSGYGRFSQEASRLASSAHNLSEFDFVVFAPPRATTRSQIAIGPAFVRDSESSISATMLSGQAYSNDRSYLEVIHEILHLMGLADLYNVNSANEAAAGLGGAYERQFAYMGVFDIMNHAYGSGLALTAWNRWVTDLITDSSIRCLPASPSYTYLTPVELAGGVKGAVIPISPSQALVFESRRILRYDSKLGKDSEGVLIYKVDTAVASGSGPMRVISRPGSTDSMFRDAPLKLGESRTVDGYQIEVVESGSWGDVIKVSQS